MSLFALPVVGGAGLGNGLFPWARAELFARAANARVLAPRWARLRIGPYLRREPEKRRYGGFFHSDEHVHGLSRLAIRARSKQVPEREAPTACAQTRRSARPTVVTYAGTGDYFASLAGEHCFIRRKLWNMTREPLRPDEPPSRAPFVAVHVRRGDITRQGFSATELADVKQYTPLSWFAAMVRSIKRIDGAGHVEVVVFSDGSAAELADLLSIAGVRLHCRRHAILDLWGMSQAGLLLASGFSTFGMWASYLGGMPTLYAPGKLQQRVQVGRPHAVEIEVSEDEAVPAIALSRLSETASVTHA